MNTMKARGIFAGMSIWFCFFTIPAWADELPDGAFVSFSARNFLVDTWVLLNVKVKNYGWPGDIIVEATGTPSGWAIRAKGGSDTAISKFVKGDETVTYQFEVKSSSSTETGHITWEASSYNLSNILYVSDSGSWAVTALFPPAAFSLSEPGKDAEEVSITPTFRWQESSGADTYHVELFNDSAGNPVATPFFTSQEIAMNSLNYSGPELSFGERYWWQVIARSNTASATTANTGGKWWFTTQFPVTPGAFQIASPVSGRQYEQTPDLTWTAAANALFYVAEIYEDNGGQARQPAHFAKRSS